MSKPAGPRHVLSVPALPCWEHFAHVADVGVRGCGRNAAEAFEQAALALSAIVADLDRIRPEQAVVIRCRSPDLELLLVAWLNAVVYEMSTRHMLFRRFAVRIDGPELYGTAWGEPVDRERHHPAVEPKGATLTELSVTHRPDRGWLAQCVVDV